MAYKNGADVITCLKMLDAGLAPHDPGMYANKDPVLEIHRILASLPPEEKKKLIRKFRKMWRKAYKIQDMTWRKGKKPTLPEKRRRIWMVWHMFAESQKTSSD